MYQHKFSIYFLFVILLITSYLPSSAQSLEELEKQRQAYEKSVNEHPYRNRPKLSPQQRKAIPKYYRPDLASEQEYLMTRDPKLGYVPAQKRYEANEKVRQLLKDRASARTEAGIPNVRWTERGPSHVGGRVQGIMFDPNDASNKKVWIGGGSGGVWVTNDVTLESPTWTKIDDFWDNLSVSWIVSAPNKTDFYVGTGEGWNGGSSIQGAGIWKSADAGKTWARLSSTANNRDFFFVQRIVITPKNTVLAGTRTGIFRSTDGGTEWAKVLNPSDETYGSGSISDMEIASDGTIYATLGISGNTGQVVKSSDDGLTWKLLARPATTVQRMELAVSPKNPNLVYIAAQGSGETMLPGGGVFKSTDGGTTWQSVATPMSIEEGGKDGASQAWINLSLAIDPNNDSHLILGGMDLYRTTDGATSWKQISKWSNNGNLAAQTFSPVHADQITTLFFPNSSTSLLFGNDGGLFYTNRIADAATIDVIKTRNNGNNITQFYAGAMHPESGSNYFLAGAQDNGTQKFTLAGFGKTTEPVGGDGAFCFIDQDTPLLQIASYTNNNYYLSRDGGISFPSISTNKDGSFINPADYDNRENILYSARDANSIQRISKIALTGDPTVTAVPLEIGTTASAFIVSPYAAQGSSTIFIGTEGGRVFKATNAHATPSLTDITGDLGQTGGNVVCVEIGASEEELILVLSNYGVKSVWITKNGGKNWVSKDETAHGLPDVPIRWALFNPSNRNQVLLATEVGIWSTDNINSDNPGWQPSNTGLANTPVRMLQYRSSDKLVAAITYGRGLYTTDVFAEETAFMEVQPQSKWFANRFIGFVDRSLKASSWAWDFDGDGTTDATTQNARYTYAKAGTYNAKLTINGKTSVTQKIEILPEPTIPYSNEFDTNDGGFMPITLKGSGKWEWGAGKTEKNNFNAAANRATIQGAGNWMTSLTSHHGFSTQYALISPPFSLKDLPTGDYFLSFDYRAILGTGAGMNMEYSTDGGITWTILGTSGDANGTNWYTEASVAGVGGNAAWVKEEFTVFNASYKINSLLGQSDVRFRFVFGAVGSANDGFQIDNFKISAPPSTPPATTAFAPSNGATSIARNTKLTLTFDRGMKAGTGNIIISQPSGTVVETIAANSSNVVYRGSTVTISMSKVLAISGATEITIDKGAIKDLVGADFEGISAGKWAFTVSDAANTAPDLDAIPNSDVLKEDAGEQSVKLTGINSGDGTSQAVNFTATAPKSSNTTLIPDANISVKYTNPEANATLTYTPATSQSGTAEISVTLTDEGGLSIVRKFTVTVKKGNDPPTFTLKNSAPPAVQQGAEGSQVIKGLVGDINDGDPEEEQELNFVITTGSNGRLSSSEEVEDIFDEIDIDVETGDFYYTLLPTVSGDFDLTIQLFDDGEGEDPRQRNGDGEDVNINASKPQKLRISVKAKPTAIEEVESKEITLYPNPNAGRFTLQFAGSLDTRFMKITVRSATGAVVYEGQRGQFVGTYQGDIDLGNVSAGVYMLTVESKNGIYRKRLVVTK